MGLIASIIGISVYVSGVEYLWLLMHKSLCETEHDRARFENRVCK